MDEPNTSTRRQAIIAGGAVSAGLACAWLTGSRPANAQTRLRDQVSILDFWSPRDGPQAASRAFAAAFDAGRVVEVPRGLRVDLVGAVRVPDGRDLVVEGIIGAAGGLAKFEVEGTSTIFTKDGLFDDVALNLRSGSPRVLGYRGRGTSHVQLILIQGSGTYTDVVIDDWQVRDCNYGIARQGVGSRLRGARITNGRAERLFGDAVEWNICTNDGGVEVIGLDIDHIDSSPSETRPNWGVGVGFAGSGYDPGWPDSKTVKDFRIAQIRGRSLRQLIHVENGHRFEISEITGEDITTSYSEGAGVECATVICYGCKSFSIDTVSNIGGPDAGIYVRFGGLNNAYVAPSRDFTISNASLHDGQLLIEPGLKGGYATVRDVVLENGTFTCIGQTETMTFERIKARRGRGVAIDVNTRGVGDGRDQFRSPVSRLRLADVEGLDGSGRNASSLRLAPETQYEMVGGSR